MKKMGGVCILSNITEKNTLTPMSLWDVSCAIWINWYNVVSSTIYWFFLPGNSSKSGSEEIQEKRWRHKVPEPKEELVNVPKT